MHSQNIVPYLPKNHILGQRVAYVTPPQFLSQDIADKNLNCEDQIVLLIWNFDIQKNLLEWKVKE